MIEKLPPKELPIGRPYPSIDGDVSRLINKVNEIIDSLPQTESPQGEKIMLYKQLFPKGERLPIPVDMQHNGAIMEIYEMKDIPQEKLDVLALVEEFCDEEIKQIETMGPKPFTRSARQVEIIATLEQHLK